MENASKALIIAGAVLIAIILVGIGVALITNSSQVNDDAETTMEAVDQAANEYATNITESLNGDDGDDGDDGE